MGKTRTSDDRLSDFYKSLHGLDARGGKIISSFSPMPNVSDFELHHIINFSESNVKEHGVKKEYLDHIGNVILLKKQFMWNLRELQMIIISFMKLNLLTLMVLIVLDLKI